MRWMRWRACSPLIRANGVVARIDWQQLKPVHEARRPRPFLKHQGRLRAGDGSSSAPGPAARPQDAAESALAQRVAAAPASLRHDLLVDFVAQEVATVLALPDRGPVPLSTGLFDLGMDSLMAVELKRRLERGAGQPLPSTLTFNYPNIDALAGFLETVLQAPDFVAVHGAAVAAAPAGQVAAAHDRALDELSDDELEQRLIARLGRIQ